jgi:hypothetical protein
MSRPTKSKTEILHEAAFAYTIDLQMYINQKTKKAFSAAFVQDHSQEPDSEVHSGTLRRTGMAVLLQR